MLNKSKVSNKFGVLMLMFVMFLSFFATPDFSENVQMPVAPIVQTVKASNTKNIWENFDVTYDGNGKNINVATKQQGGAWNTVITKYKNFITGVSALAAITCVVIFIIKLLQLVGSASNPAERSKLLVGLVWSGIGAACLGAVGVFVGVFYNAI